MAEEIRKVTETTTHDAGDTVRTRRDEVADSPSYQKEHKRTVAERVVWYVAGLLLVLLAFRFVLALLGANPSNGFADFIYTTSRPFVAPFFGLFNYDTNFGVSEFEIFTLIAMAVYALVAYGITKLIAINR